MGLEVAAVGLGLAAIGVYNQYESGKAQAAAGRQQAAALQDQAVAQRDQLELNRKQADLTSARQVRQSVRQARMARATVINAGANSGTLNSSGVQGGVSSVVAQNSANMSFFSQMGTLNSGVLDTQIAQGAAAARAGQAGGDITVAQAEGAQAGALANLGGTIFSAAGGYKTIFSGGK